ncbi:MAG TPA: diaminopimelate decarboxylase [Verrucomicrobiae bacterium]|nr:diaminopimelate decarboxylase [Verrucomicrobiae bacterium]
MSTTKTLPFDAEHIRVQIAQTPTPFHIYDEAGIRCTTKELMDAFSWAPGFINYFAIKALPNPEILKLMQACGMGVDCSSMAELVLAERTGFRGEQIMFTSNDTATEEFTKADELGAIINLDDISHIQFLESTLDKLPELLCFRFNPGPARSGNVIIGKPEEAKYGLTRKQLFAAYEQCKNRGIRRFGLHTMLASNELEACYFADTARMLFELAVEVKTQLGIELEFINLGGGIGIPYVPEQSPVDIYALSRRIQELYESILTANGLGSRLFMECGRYVTGPHGYLVSTVLHLKHTYRDYVGLDASMANLMRPALYGAYHHITVLDKEQEPLTHTYDVTGSLCENNDKFAVQRMLPEIVAGDVLILHDTGAHGHAMGFNYNGKLRSAELLMRPDSSFKLIRRAETLDDYFATLTDF